MSQLEIGIIAAFAGGLITYLLNLSSQSRANFATRTNAIAAVRDEFAAAQVLIAAANEASGLWSPPHSLLGGAWGTFGWQLASLLGEDDLREIKTVRRLLEVVDRSVERIQAEAGEEGREQVVPAYLASRVEGLGGRLEKALGILDRGLGNARTELKRTRIASGVAVLAIVGAVVAGALLPGISGGPAVTASSVAKQLQAESRNSDLAVCDKSNVFEGAFRCAVDFPGCNGQLEASTGKPACPAPRQKIYKVLADKDCFEATMMEMIENGAPAPHPPGEPSREETRVGCIDD